MAILSRISCQLYVWDDTSVTLQTFITYSLSAMPYFLNIHNDANGIRYQVDGQIGDLYKINMSCSYFTTLDILIM